jgi:hypothetical protein
MEEIKKAYQILGLSEAATLDELEKQYSIWVRREKNRNRLGEKGGEAETIDFAAINAAYRLIRQKLDEQSNSEASTATHKRPRWIEKMDHFWEYYKLHTIGSIILIVIIGSIIQGVIQNQREKAIEASLPPIDSTITLFGEFRMFAQEPDLSPMEQQILTLMPEWQRVKIDYVYAPLEARDQFDIGMQQRSMIVLATERPDIYIVDDRNFARLARQGAFLPLTSMSEGWKSQLGEDKLIYATVEGETQIALLGLDITSSRIFEGLQITDGPKIMVIRGDSQNQEKAVNLMRQLVAEMEKN